MDSSAPKSTSISCLPCYRHSRDLTFVPVWYKGFTITPRTFQIRGSGRWTLDLSICGSSGLRVFTGPLTYATEAAAITGCCNHGRRIIDGRIRDSSVDGLG